MGLTERLMALKEEIDQSITEEAKEQGKLQSSQERLKKDFKCQNLSEAKKKITEMEKDFEDTQNELEAGIEMLEKELRKNDDDN